MKPALLHRPSPLSSPAAGLVRQLCAWLRLAGVALHEAGQRVSTDLDDKRAQRAVLFDELHELRTSVRRWGGGGRGGEEWGGLEG